MSRDTRDPWELARGSGSRAMASGLADDLDIVSRLERAAAGGNSSPSSPTGDRRWQSLLQGTVEAAQGFERENDRLRDQYAQMVSRRAVHLSGQAVF